MTHTFKFTGKQDLQELFQDTNKFSTLVRKIGQMAQRNPTSYDPDKYKGDAFEYFVELFLQAFNFDDRVGVSNYSPMQENDNGVDGIGSNLRGEKSVVQVKYRSDSTQLLTGNGDHLVNMISSGIIDHKVSPIENIKDVPKHYIFTTAEGLHHYTDQENFKGRVRCFGYKDFKKLVDNNINFWNYCRQQVSTPTTA